MDNFVMINGKKFRLVPEETQEEPVKKLTGYERAVPGEKYFFADAFAEVNEYTDNNSTYESDLYITGNYSTDRKLAENNARADRLMRQLRRFAVEHGGIVTKYNPTEKEMKYYILYHRNSGLIVDWTGTFCSHFGVIYFFDKKNSQGCYRSIPSRTGMVLH